MMSMSHWLRCTGLARIFLVAVLPVGLVAPAIAASIADDPPGIDCSQFFSLGLDKQTNMYASLAQAQCEGGGSSGGAAHPGGLAQRLPQGRGGDEPANIPNVVVNNATADAFPHVTQSESFVANHDSIVVVNYNSSTNAASRNYSGLSYSIDDGASFTEIRPSPLASGHGFNFGDPIVAFRAKDNTFYAGDLVTACGGFGIGLWKSVDGITWTAGACAHSGFNNDRESMWVDNSPASPFYGRIYISWNDFARGAALFVTHSDDGVTWSAVRLTAGFIRDVQVTGGPDGTVFVAAADEGGGRLNPRTHVLFRSTDGGASWTSSTMAANQSAPGTLTCGPFSYFAGITPIWRYLGWGQPGVGPDGVVHYVYGVHGAGSDVGDIMYVRSTDNGLTWSPPIRLNDDGTTREQWMPSLIVSSDGTVVASWYDRRNTTDGLNYDYYSVSSFDNGVTWQPNQRISSQLIPQPEQPDPFVQSCYAGDYNYPAVGVGNIFHLMWTDGRIAISGHQQQDVFSARLIGPPVDKDQCKGGGWQQFNNPTFKNQGQCVSFTNQR